MILHCSSLGGMTQSDDSHSRRPPGQSGGGGSSGDGDGRSPQHSIGQRLQRMYDEVVSEDLPEDWLDIIDKIERSEGSGGSDQTQ